MSVTATSIARVGALTAAVAVVVPALAIAAPPHKAGKPAKAAPAVCDHALPPGIAKKGGALPPGIAKKVKGDGPPCEGHPQPAGPEAAPATGQAPSTASAVAPAPAAPAVTTASSTNRPACASRRAFRLRLDRNGRVRTARVVLNGRAIPVTRGKRRTTVLIDLRGRRAGMYVVRTSVVTRKGKLVTGTHRYRTCG
jgi:hypothetical protein